MYYKFCYAQSVPEFYTSTATWWCSPQDLHPCPRVLVSVGYDVRTLFS